MNNRYNEIIPSDAIRVIETLNNSGYEAYLVGGCVRDMIRGIEPHDYDITTSAHPEQIKEIFPFHRTLLVVVQNQDHYPYYKR